MRRAALLLLPLLALPVIASAPASVASTAKAGDPVLLRDHLAGFDNLPRHVGPEQPDTTVEPSIAVNPKNPLNAVIGFQVGRVAGGGDATNGYAVTFDGGKTWKNGYIPGLTTGRGGAFDRASDSVLAFGPNNTVYYSSLIFNDTSGNGLESAIVNNTSTDGGKTWVPSPSFRTTRVAASTTRTGSSSTRAPKAGTTSAGSTSSGTASPA